MSGYDCFSHRQGLPHTIQSLYVTGKTEEGAYRCCVGEGSSAQGINTVSDITVLSADLSNFLKDLFYT